MSSPLQSTRRVLVVDDNQDNRNILRRVLQRKGVCVLEAEDGQEAIEVAHSQHPDGILMDLSMPVLDGFEATRQLKELEDTKEIPIVAVSAHCSDREMHNLALAAGCLFCIEKPFDWGLIDRFLQAI